MPVHALDGLYLVGFFAGPCPVGEVGVVVVPQVQVGGIVGLDIDGHRVGLVGLGVGESLYALHTGHIVFVDRNDTHLELGGLGEGEVFAAGVNDAVLGGRGGLGSVGGVDQCDPVERGFHVDGDGAAKGASASAHDGITDNKSIFDVVLPVKTAGDTVAADGCVENFLIALRRVAAGGIAQLQAHVAVGSFHNPCDTVIAGLGARQDFAHVVHACRAACLDHVADVVVPIGVHEVRIEQARRAGHGQDEGVGLLDAAVGAVLIVVVAAVGGQVLERVVVVNEGDGIAAHVMVADEAGIPEPAVMAVVEGLVDFAHQREVECRALVCSIHVGAGNPSRDVGLRAPVFAHAEGRAQNGVVLGIMNSLEAHGIVVAEA